MGSRVFRIETVPDFGDGVMKAGTDSADGDAQSLCHLGVGESLGKTEVEDLALERIQTRDGFAGRVDAIVGRWNRGYFLSAAVEGNYFILFRPGRLTEMAGDAEEVTAGALELSAFLQATRHL